MWQCHNSLGYYLSMLSYPPQFIAHNLAQLFPPNLHLFRICRPSLELQNLVCWLIPHIIFSFLIIHSMSSTWNGLFFPSACLQLLQLLLFFWERESMRAGEGQRKGKTQNQVPGWAVSKEPDGGARTHKQWDHDLSRSQTLNRLSHAGAPIALEFLKKASSNPLPCNYNKSYIIPASVWKIWPVTSG